MNTIFKKGLRSWSKIKTVITYRKLIRTSIKTFRPVLKITNKRIMKYVSMVTIFTMVFGLGLWSSETVSADVLSGFPDSFGSSNTDDIPDWIDGGGAGTDDDSDTRVQSGSPRTESSTPQHTRLGDGGFITRTVDTTGYENIVLKYYWRGDNDADGSSDNLKVQWKKTSDPTFLTENTHQMDGNEEWSSQESISLPSEADNTSIDIRFWGDSNDDDDEEGRVDDVSVEGDLIADGSISGYKFNDLDGDGVWDQDGDNPEPGISGWTVTLDNGDEVTTDENGYYIFEGLENNTYTVCEEMEADEDSWTQTYPNSDSDNISDADIYEYCDEESDLFERYGYEVEIDEDQAEELNFGNVQYGSITIQKVTDPEEMNPDNEAGGFEFTVTDQENSVVESGDSTTYDDLVAGNYNVQELVPEGWQLDSISCEYGESEGQEIENGKTVVLGAGDDVTCTFTNTKLGTITIWKYADPFGGSFDFELQGPTSGETTIFTGEEGGSYVFENLEPGEYSLSEDVPDGWTSDGGSCGEDGSPSDIELSAGGNVSCVFNNTEYGSISGRKFEDLNANHEDDEDPGLEWDINLYQLDDEEWSFVTSEESDGETGNYMFDNLLPGTYKVCETSEEDWTQSYPESGSDCEGSYGYEVVVSAGQDVLDQDFGNYQKGSITGYKFEDINGDGGWGEESVLSEWTIYIDANNDGFLNDGETSTTTDENGYYSFTNLEPGNYIIREVSQDGWVQKLPSDGNGYEVTIASGEVEDGNHFGNFKKPIITVYKYNDLDNGGDLDKEESALENWTLALGRVGTRQQPEQPAGPDNQIPIEIVAMSLTGIDGSVRFTVDQPGDYKAFEAQQDGWSVTSPGHIDSFFDITYDLDSIAIGDPDFDLLSIGDPDFDLLRSSFFDVFVDISGQNINSDNQERPLIFLNHLPSPTPTPTPTPSETPTPTPEPSETPTPTPTPEPENNGGGGGGGGGNPGVIIDGPGANPPSGGGTVAGASTTPTPIPTPTPSSTPSTSGSGESSSSSGTSGGGEPSPTPEVTGESPTPTPSETPAPSESPLPEDSNLFAEFLNSLPDSWVWLLPLFVLIALFFIWLSRRS